MYGELIPVGGGDPIPLLKKNLLVGRRESCDIVLRFSNVSAHHCQLTINGGYWYVKDLESRNGIKVNGVRVTEKRLTPGDELLVAKHRYEVQYSPLELGAVGPPPDDDVAEDIMQRSLLERAGLVSKASKRADPPVNDTDARRFDVMDDSPGQIKDPNRPV
jgi:pSer/pThr/pTyr-binding forkhead associated (FHA) protein